MRSVQNSTHFSTQAKCLRASNLDPRISYCKASPSSDGYKIFDFKCFFNSSLFLSRIIFLEIKYFSFKNIV